jgi:surfeit locus 1 family protein
MRLRDLIPAFAALVVIALTASLGRWQLQRAEEKAVAASAREAAVSRAPVALNPGSGSESLDGHLLEVQGIWLPDKTIFLDNRTRKGVAGFHVLTPLRLGTDGVRPADAQTAVHVLVLRGWVARDVLDRTRLPSVATPTGPIRLEGLGMSALAQPMRLAKGADVDPGAPRIWQHLDPGHYARWSGLTMHPLMVRQLSDTEDGLMRDWVLPGSGEDKHRAYAFQWFAMSTVTALAWAGLAWRRRQRARD